MSEGPDYSDLYRAVERAESAADRALDAAREAMGEAREAKSEARDASRTAERADERAEQALSEAAELRKQLNELETFVERLLQMLEEELQRLRAETIRVRESVHEQGEALQGRMEVNTGALREGFTARTRQEAEGRLLDSRSALRRLVDQLLAMQASLEEQSVQARRRAKEQRDRWEQAHARTIEAHHRDVERLGRRIIEVQHRDFGGTMHRHVELARAEPEAFGVARDYGRLSLEERAEAMRPHLDALDVNLEDFARRRVAILQALEPFVHANLPLETGDYAVRCYFTESDAGTEFMAGADVTVGRGRVEVTPVVDGLAGLAAAASDESIQDARMRTRNLDAGEQRRLESSLELLRRAGCIDASELDVIHAQLRRRPVEIVEIQGGSAA